MISLSRRNAPVNMRDDTGRGFGLKEIAASYVVNVGIQYPSFSRPVTS